LVPPLLASRAFVSLLRLRNASTLALAPVSGVSFRLSPTNSRAEWIEMESSVLFGCGT
jgi:hypothetical protein